MAEPRFLFDHSNDAAGPRLAMTNQTMPVAARTAPRTSQPETPVMNLHGSKLAH